MLDLLELTFLPLNKFVDLPYINLTKWFLFHMLRLIMCFKLDYLILYNIIKLINYWNNIKNYISNKK